MQGSWHKVIFQRQHCFDKAKNSRRRFGMSDVGLDRTDWQRLRSALREDGSNCPQLRWIAYLRSGSVPLNEDKVIPIKAVFIVHGTQQLCLRLSGRQRNSVGSTGRIRARGNEGRTAPATFRSDAISTPQNNCASAFSADISLTVLPIGPAKPFWRQHSGLRKTNE